MGDAVQAFIDATLWGGEHLDALVDALIASGEDLNRSLLEAGALPDVSGIERTASNRSAFQYVDGVLKPALKVAFQLKVRDHRRILVGALRKIFKGRLGRVVPPEDALAHVARFWMPPEGF